MQIKIDRRYVACTISALLILSLLAVVGQVSRKYFYINLTRSEPIGIYRTKSFNGKLSRGDLVVFSPPKQYERYVYGRKWLVKGWPLIKSVGGLPGDLFCVKAQKFFVRGEVVGEVFSSDSVGLPLPKLRGCFYVRPGYFLPIATRISNSFDGRYMGDIPQNLIIAKATPIFTLK